MLSGRLVNSSNQTTTPFQFPFIVLLHDRDAFFNFNPCHQLYHSSPSTSTLVANFIPRSQLQPSSPSTSTLIAFQFPNLIAFLFPPLLHDACGVQLLPDELVTKIIIHSIKDEPIFHFEPSQ
jgi:hypothetical protein